MKEGTQGILHTLPYNCLSVLFAHLHEFVAARMSIFKSSTRPCDITAFQILHGRPFNAKIDGHIEFGSYCQVSDAKMSNSMEARTLGSIALGQIHNGTGTCKFLSLRTGKPFTANHFTVLLITDEVVEHLNNMAKKDRTPTRERIFRLHGVDLSDESPIPELKISPTTDPYHFHY